MSNIQSLTTNNDEVLNMKKILMAMLIVCMFVLFVACSADKAGTKEMNETTETTTEMTTAKVEVEAELQDEMKVEPEVNDETETFAKPDEPTTSTTESPLKLEELPVEINGVTFKEATLVIVEGLPEEPEVNTYRYDKLVIKVEGNSKDFSFTYKDASLGSVEQSVFYENGELIHYKPYGIEKLNIEVVSDNKVKITGFSENCKTIKNRARDFSEFIVIDGNIIPGIEFNFENK